jgi:hypothetical protein
VLLLAMHWHTHHNGAADRNAKGHGNPNTLHACALQLRNRGKCGCDTSCCRIWLRTKHARLPWLLLLLLTEPCQCGSGVE